MMSLKEWFKKHTKTPLVVLISFMVLINVLFFFYAIQNHIETQDKNLKDLIVSTVLIGIQQNDRVLIESSLERAVENLEVRSAFFCKNEQVILNTTSYIKSCKDISDPLFFNRKVSFTDLGFGEYQVHFIAPNFSFSNSYFVVFLACLIILFASVWIMYFIRKKFQADILTPMTEIHLDKEHKTSIKEFEDIKSAIKSDRLVKQGAAFTQAVLESKDKFNHNIKSPLRNIKILKNSLSGTLEQDDELLFESVLDEVSGLAESLKIENPFDQVLENSKSKKAIFDVEAVVTKSIKKKLLEWQGSCSLSLQSTESPLPSLLDVTELRSILSNLLNNSKDAGATEVVVSLERLENHLVIQVIDNGSGVPEKIKDKIFNKDFTFGKDGGTGYGLYHAKKFINDWGGQIELSSEESKTVFDIRLPLWSYSSVELNEDELVIILEDKKIMRQRIRKKLLGNGVQEKCLREFSKSSDFLKWSEQNEGLSYVLLADNDLGIDQIKGVDLIRSLGSSVKAHLLTDGHEDSPLVEKAQENAINLIPKCEFDKASIQFFPESSEENNELRSLLEAF